MSHPAVWHISWLPQKEKKVNICAAFLLPCPGGSSFVWKCILPPIGSIYNNLLDTGKSNLWWKPLIVIKGKIKYITVRAHQYIIISLQDISSFEKIYFEKIYFWEDFFLRRFTLRKKNLRISFLIRFQSSEFGRWIRQFTVSMVKSRWVEKNGDSVLKFDSVHKN